MTDPEPADELPQDENLEPEAAEPEPESAEAVPPVEDEPQAAYVDEPPAPEPSADDAADQEPVGVKPAKKSRSKKAAETDADEEAPAVVVSDAAPSGPDNKNWYIVKVQSGREESIKAAIERRVKLEGLEEFFGQILVPVEKVSMLVGGKRVVRKRKMYPGYIMAYVEYNDRILYLFRETSGVGDFVGASVNRAPAPMPPREVERMLHTQAPDKVGKGADATPEKIKIPFDKGDKVRVSDGTFAGMEGEVKEIMEPKDAKEVPRVRVELTIFGRPVPVEVEIWQVQQA